MDRDPVVVVVVGPADAGRVVLQAPCQNRRLKGTEFSKRTISIGSSQ